MLTINLAPQTIMTREHQPPKLSKLMIDLERQRFFWSRTEKVGEHLIWTGSQGPRDYGIFYLDGRGTKVYAHRVSYCIAHNLDLEDIEDKIILRICDRNDCVKAEHLIAKPKKKKQRNRK